MVERYIRLDRIGVDTRLICDTMVMVLCCKGTSMPHRQKEITPLLSLSHGLKLIQNEAHSVFFIRCLNILRYLS